MTEAEVAKVIHHPILKDFEPVLHGLVREMISVSLEDQPPAQGKSKFGGNPDLPKDMPWPQVALESKRSGKKEDAPMEFLCQLNLAELPKLEIPKLPPSGMIWIFHPSNYFGNLKEPGYPEGSPYKISYEPLSMPQMALIFGENSGSNLTPRKSPDMYGREFDNPLSMKFLREFSLPCVYGGFFREEGAEIESSPQAIMEFNRGQSNFYQENTYLSGGSTDIALLGHPNFIDFVNPPPGVPASKLAINECWNLFHTGLGGGFSCFIKRGDLEQMDLSRVWSDYR